MSRHATTTDALSTPPPRGVDQEARNAEGDRLYDQYVRPLEAEHWGAFVVVVPDGRMIISPSHRDVVWRAAEELARSGFVFKIGDRVVGTLR